ncbi:uncharacterized protein ACWYII_032061 [Salvelinus alpinus]
MEAARAQERCSCHHHRPSCSSCHHHRPSCSSCHHHRPSCSSCHHHRPSCSSCHHHRPSCSSCHHHRPSCSSCHHHRPSCSSCHHHRLSCSSSVTTTAPPAAATTSAAVASSDPPSSSEGTLSLQFRLNQTFNSELSNPSSSEFKNLAAKVTSEVNKAFAKTPGFRRSIVRSFRSGSVVTDMTLVFDKQTSVPSSSSVPALLTSSSTSLNILSGTITAVTTTTPTPAAATTSASPDPPSSSEGAMSLQFSLDQTFNSDLSNSSSSEFKNLAAKVTSEVNKAFAKTPGFRRSIVRSFRSGSVVTDMIVVFDKQSSVPSSSSVPALLTSSFTSLSLIPGSISAAAVTTTPPAAAVNTTTPAAATTSAAVASPDPPSSSEGAMSLQFSLDQTFNSDLSNSSSSEFKNLAAKVTSEVNKAFAKTPGFRRSIVRSFRSGSVVTDMIVVFDKQSSVPSSSSVPALLTSSFTSLSLIPGSISAAAVNTTAPAAATTSAAVASPDPPSSSEGAISLQFSLNQTFNSDLSNSSSSEFKNLAAKVTSEVNKAFAKTPGFRRSIVRSFRSGSVVTNMTLVFDNQTSVPSSSSVPALLTSSSPSLNILSGSISAAVTTTAPPAAAVTTTAPAAAVTTTAPAAAVTTTAPPAAAVTTTAPPAAATTSAAVASPDPPSSSEGAMSLQFSLNQTFNSDLSNSSSSAFKNLAAKVTSEVNKAFAKTPGFRRSIVRSFRSGSVVTNMTVVFDNQTSVPSSSSVPALLTNSSTSLNILSGTISAAAVTTTPPAAAVTTAPAAAVNTTAPAAAVNTTAPAAAVNTTAPAAAVNTTAPAAAVNTTAPAAAVNTTAPAAAVNTTAPAAAVNTTAPAAAVNTTTAPVAATTSAAVASPDPPSSSEGAMSLQFSLDQTFNSDLSNSSSSEFKNLAAKVTSEVKKAFSNIAGFRRSIVKSFRSGSVVTDMIVVFDKQSSVPSSSRVPALLTSSFTSLSLIPGSISAGSSTTSGSAPRPTAFSQAALPLSLALLMVQLLAS